MRPNLFHDLHTDTELPATFNLRQWKTAWNGVVGYLREQANAFEENPSWETYEALGEGIARINILKETIIHVPLFLGGCDESVRKREEQAASTDAEQVLVAVKPAVMDFLESEAYGAGLSQKIKEETVFWSSFSLYRAQCLQVYHEIQEEEPLIFTDKLQGLNDYPALKRKTLNKAKEWGHVGHVLNARDCQSDFLMRLQGDEDTRKFLWKSLQRNAPTQGQVDKMLNLRHKIAQENNFTHYMGYLMRSSAGVTPKAVQKLFKNTLASVAPTHHVMTDALAVYGAQRTKWEGSVMDFHRPWNHQHLMLEGETAGLALSGKEFPLKRILNFIIPDLLSVGGWEMIDEKPQRLGRKKNVLYLYRLQREEHKALLYFAPHPYESYSDSDNFQAYAAILRERSVANEHERAPICLVAQNLDLEHGAVTDVQQLVYLAHEIGHVLHNFAYNNRAFETFSRIPHVLSEFPSVFFEAMAMCPTVLQRWTDPKAPASNRRLNYWERRVRPDKSSLVDFVYELESSWIDMEANCGPARNLRNIRDRLREDVGLPLLQRDDREVYTNFDFTENAGSTYSYLAGRALRRKILGKAPSELKIRSEMRYLLDEVLEHTADLRIAQKWKTAYNSSVMSMMEDGMKQLAQDHLTRAKAFSRSLAKKIS